MRTIVINKTKKTDSGWTFSVSVDNYIYSVSLDEAYFQDIAGEDMVLKEFVKKSFQFLLEREPPEAILKEFNIKIISTYFPEYESVMSGAK